MGYPLSEDTTMADEHRYTSEGRAKAQSRLRTLTKGVIVVATGATAAIGVIVAREHPGASAGTTGSGATTSPGSTSTGGAVSGGSGSSTGNTGSTGTGGTSGNSGSTGNTGSTGSTGGSSFAPSPSSSSPNVVSGGSA